MIKNSLNFAKILLIIILIKPSESIYSKETRLKILNQLSKELKQHQQIPQIQIQQQQQRQQQQQQQQEQQHSLPQKISYDKNDDVVVESYDTHEIKYNNDNNSVAITKTRNKRELSDLFIVPNTRWCGRGNIANGTYNHLGGASTADKCCRKHDHCHNYIPALSRRYDFVNLMPYTLSHCKCDRSFRTCLKMANDEDANTIGKLYFNVVQTQCFVLRHERVCSKRALDNSCIERQEKTKAILKRNKKY